MKLSQVKNYKLLVDYVAQNDNLQIKKFTPLPPYETKDIKLLIHYETPIAFIVGEEIFTPHYVKENYISRTTAKISTQLCEFSTVVSMESFIEMLYNEYQCSIQGRNSHFIERYIKILVGD